jgi:hypothetical protein
MLRWMLACSFGVALLGCGLSRADCQAELEQAMSLLNRVQKEALENKHPNMDTFAADFQGCVEKMQQEKCLPELQKLMEYIGEEQKKYPLTPGERPLMTPVMD